MINVIRLNIAPLESVDKNAMYIIVLFISTLD